MLNWMSGLWVVVLAVAAAAAVFGLRHAPASAARPGSARMRRQAGATRAHAVLDHVDFSEETLPAVLTRSSQWDER